MGACRPLALVARGKEASPRTRELRRARRWVLGVVMMTSGRRGHTPRGAGLTRLAVDGSAVSRTGGGAASARSLTLLNELSRSALALAFDPSLPPPLGKVGAHSSGPWACDQAPECPLSPAGRAGATPGLDTGTPAGGASRQTVLAATGPAGCLLPLDYDRWGGACLYRVDGWHQRGVADLDNVEFQRPFNPCQSP